MEWIFRNAMRRPLKAATETWRYTCLRSLIKGKFWASCKMLLHPQAAGSQGFKDACLRSIREGGVGFQAESLGSGEMTPTNANRGDGP